MQNSAWVPNHCSTLADSSEYINKCKKPPASAKYPHTRMLEGMLSRKASSFWNTQLEYYNVSAFPSADFPSQLEFRMRPTMSARGYPVALT